MAHLLRVLGNRDRYRPVLRRGKPRGETIEDIQRGALVRSLEPTIPDPLFPFRFLLCLTATVLFVAVLPFVVAHLLVP